MSTDNTQHRESQEAKKTSSYQAPHPNKDEQQQQKTKQKAAQTKKEEVANEELLQPHSLKELIEMQATDEDMPLSSNLKLEMILGGNVLSSQVVKKQIGLIVLITCFILVYIACRYNVQQKLILIDKLQTTLQETKFKARAKNSLLTEKTRESHVLELLKNNKDSVLKIPTQPPYIIKVPTE